MSQALTIDNATFRLPEALKRLRENKNWYSKSYSAYFFGIHCQFVAIARAVLQSPYAVPYGINFQNHTTAHHLDCFWDQEFLKQKRALILEEVIGNPKFIEDFKNEWDKRRKNFLEHFSPYESLDFSTHTNEELAEILKDLYETYVNYAGWGYIVDTFLTNEETDWLVSEIKTELGDAATHEVIATLTLPVYNSFVNESRIDLYHIVLARRDKKDIDPLIDGYINKYFWIRNNYIHYSKITRETVLLEVEETLEKHPNIEDVIAEEESRISNNIKNKAALMDTLEVSNRLRSILAISELFTHIQDERKEGVLRSNAAMYSLLQEAATRFNIADPYIFYHTFEEAYDLLYGKEVDQEIIRKRCDTESLTVYTQEGYKIILPENYGQYCDLAVFFPDTDGIHVVKGAIAYKGIVKGVVRVCKTVKDIADFKSGEILVANQTTPEYVPAMQKAAAFVTDQGGITCHAAIIARELKKPCVIGTKIATQALKDGDMVEVNADQGIITKL